MFGFFKKKSGEVPEEQERLQKAAAREAERKEAAAIPEELRALGQKFLPEEFSILAVTGAGGFGGSRPQENGPWLAVLELTAWKEEDSDQPAYREKTQLVALADDKLMEYLRRRVRGDSVFQIMVRPSEDGKQFLMTELPQPEIDPEMKAILEEQKKPVSIWVPELGTFTLNRLVNWFEAEVEWLGQPARLDIDREEDWDACVEQAKALMADQKGWDEKVRSFAAQELLDQANDWAQDAAEGEEPEEITREQFMERLELDAVQISAGGRFEFWFNDGDLFWGHAIHVTGSLDQGPEMAQMEG